MCERHRRECHVLLQGMRFFPRVIGMAIYLGMPQLCEWLIPANHILHGAFVFCYSLQPHLALSVVLCSVRSHPRPAKNKGSRRGWSSGVGGGGGGGAVCSASSRWCTSGGGGSCLGW